MGGALGIKEGEYWAYRHGARWPLFRAYVIDPGTHYDADIRIMVQDGPVAGVYSVRRSKLPCKWEYVQGYLDANPEIPRDMDARFASMEEEPPNPTLATLRLQEELIRRVVRGELERMLSTDVPKLAYSVREAAAATGYSEGTLRYEIQQDRLIPSYANSKAVIRKEELERWLQSLPMDPR